MVYVLALLFLCSIVGLDCKSKDLSMINSLEKDAPKSRTTDSVLVLLIILILVSFSGLRTVGNDTAIYIKNFSNRIPDSLFDIPQIDWSIGSNPLFSIYCIVIKALISSNPYVFIFISAIIVQVSIILFLRKYAPDFGFSLFLYIAFTVYAFTMAAMKQSLATAIAIWAVPMLSRGKKALPVFLILLATMVHPYVIIFLFAGLLNKNIWDNKTALILFATLIVSIFLQPFLETVLNVASGIGDEYNIDDFTGSAGMSLFRVAIYCVVPLLSFVYRKKIRETNNSFYFISINLSIIAMCFAILGVFGGANMFGRMANYFDIFYCLSLSIILKHEIINSQERLAISTLAYIGFTIFYIMYYLKYLNAEQYASSWLSDFYKHVSFFELFK